MSQGADREISPSDADTEVRPYVSELRSNVGKKFFPTQSCQTLKSWDPQFCMVLSHLKLTSQGLVMTLPMDFYHSTPQSRRL